MDAQGCPIPDEPEVISYTFEDVFFDFDSATITAEGEAKLREIGSTLITIMSADIEVHGHTDATGPEEYNMGLSQRRAEAVRDWLLTNFSQLNSNQFTVRQFGETQPIATNDTRDGPGAEPPGRDQGHHALRAGPLQQQERARGGNSPGPFFCPGWSPGMSLLLEVVGPGLRRHGAGGPFGTSSGCWTTVR